MNDALPDSRTTFEVTAVDTATLRGEFATVALSEFAQLEIRRFSWCETTLLVVMGGLATLLVAMASGAERTGRLAEIMMLAAAPPELVRPRPRAGSEPRQCS